MRNKTAAVEVKTLTITGKQVTLAVFRQLYDGPPTAIAAKLASNRRGALDVRNHSQ
jgi:hypothetical protein